MAQTTANEPVGRATTTTTRKVALYTAGTIFAAAAVGHLVRLFAGFEIAIGGIFIPVWGSFPAALISAALAVWMVVAARR